jgi:signal transduction histidine kinase
MAPRTIRGQITIIILLALLTVTFAGRFMEKWAKDALVVADLDIVSERIKAIAVVMGPASPAERQVMLANARRAGWDISLEPASTADRFQPPSRIHYAVAFVMDLLFPSDSQPPIGGWRTYLDDHPVIAAKVDEQTILMHGGIPASILTSSAVGQGSYYFVALIVLIAFFFIFAIRTITEPLKQVSAAAAEADLVKGTGIFEEKGPVEILALARALNGMRDRINAMMDARTRMLRGIGHDLRTPLTRLRLRADRMSEGPLRDALLTDVDRIDRLLAESLNYLHHDYANEAVERIDVASMLQTICNEFSDLGFDVTYSGPQKYPAYCRPLSLTRAITNLCDNAVKYASIVTVTLDRTQRGFVIAVADDGPGIPEELRERVFEPFFRIDASRSKDKGGFGLGLSIVRDIAKSHQGTVELLSGVPNGLVAQIAIPTDRPSIAGRTRIEPD